jgi:alkylation response protein AidB-like acyl-CoA dehydrogenase
MRRILKRLRIPPAPQRAAITAGLLWVLSVGGRLGHYVGGGVVSGTARHTGYVENHEMQIYEGTNQIQRMVMARQLLK